MQNDKDEQAELKEISRSVGTNFEALQSISRNATTPYESLSIHSFAPDWYTDCRNEIECGIRSTNREHVSSIRREIVFAVSLAESYLFEWIRDHVCRGNFDQLLTYFPIGAKRRAYDK